MLADITMAPKQTLPFPFHFLYWLADSLPRKFAGRYNVAPRPPEKVLILLIPAAMGLAAYHLHHILAFYQPTSFPFYPAATTAV